MKIRLIAFILAMTAMYSCYYDVEETLYPASSCDTQSVSYSATIVPILQEQCYTCHSDATKAVGGGISLQGHAQLLTYVNNGKFLGSIKHLPGFSAMPSNGGKMSDCRIARVEAWINAGAKND